MKTKKTLTDKVYFYTSKIPKGKVSTYKLIAQKCGTKAYRVVGQILSRNPYAPTVPCHRVIRSDGHVGGFKGKKFDIEKVRLLKKEGVQVINKRIDKKYFQKI